MAFCTKCGVQMDDNAKTCPACGYTEERKENNAASNFAGLNNTADLTSSMDPADIEKNRIMAVLAYLSWLVLIPLFAAPGSNFARFHVNQGLVLALAEIGWAIISAIVSFILGLISPFLSIIGTLLGIVNIVFIIFSILGLINAINGKAKELPIIGKVRILK